MRVTGQIHAPAVLPLEKELTVPTELQARLVPELAVYLGEEKNILLVTNP